MTVITCPHGHWSEFECLKCDRAKRDADTPSKRDLLLELADAIVDMAGELNMDAKADRVRKLAAKVRGK